MAPHVHTHPVIFFFPQSGEPVLIWTCLALLSTLAEQLDFLGALPRVDIEVTVPDPGAECPFCDRTYPLDSSIPGDCPNEIPIL